MVLLYLRILRNSKSALLKVCSHYFQTGSESNRVSYRSPKACFTYQVQYRKHIQTLLWVIVLKRLKTWTSLTSELWHTHDIHMLTPPAPKLSGLGNMYDRTVILTCLLFINNPFYLAYKLVTFLHCAPNDPHSMRSLLSHVFAHHHRVDSFWLHSSETKISTNF